MSGTGRSCILTGIGGQGVQLAGQTLARAALRDGLETQLFQNYGGLMRGGQTEASVVIDSEPVKAPAVLSSTWSAIALHHEYWAPVRDRLRPEGLAIINSSVVTDAGLDDWVGTIVEIPAADVAVDLGDIQLGSMVMLGAWCAVTDLVSLESLCAGVGDALPSYRQDGARGAIAGLRAGHGLESLPGIGAAAIPGVAT